MNDQLKGKVAVVTGATSGIGFATAKAILEAGACVVMVARDEESLRSMSEPLDKHDNAITQVTDLLDFASCEAMIPEIIKKVGRIDILHSNAGSYIGGELIAANAREIDNMLTLNVNAVIRNVHAVIPHMMEHGGGDIVVTCSIAGHRALAHEPVYSASKNAITCFVQAVRRQTRHSNIRVSQVSPGPVISALLDDWPKEKLNTAINEGSLMEPTEVAETILFLLSRPRNVTVHDVVLLPTVCDF